MTAAKQAMIELVQHLDDSAEWEDIEEQIFLIRRLELAEKEIAEGKVIPHEEVKKRFSKWLK